MKKIISLFLAVILCLSLSVTAFADAPTAAPAETQAGKGEVLPQWEQTEWVYRVHNGNVEKRLWSNTYGEWLTDWIYVCPYSPETE